MKTLLFYFLFRSSKYFEYPVSEKLDFIENEFLENYREKIDKFQKLFSNITSESKYIFPEDVDIKTFIHWESLAKLISNYDKNIIWSYFHNIFTDINGYLCVPKELSPVKKSKDDVVYINERDPTLDALGMLLHNEKLKSLLYIYDGYRVFYYKNLIYKFFENFFPNYKPVLYPENKGFAADEYYQNVYLPYRF